MDIEDATKKYCSTCLNRKKNYYCRVLKKKILKPDEPYCSWWKGEIEKILKHKKSARKDYMHKWYMTKKKSYL